MGNIINVPSETAKLKKVLLHKPGNELLNLMPDYLEEMLFDDIPWLSVARQEHDEFAKTLTDNGVEVVYLRDLIIQSLVKDKVREELVDEYIAEALIYSGRTRNRIKDHLLKLSLSDMVDTMISGLRKNELPDNVKRHLSDYLKIDYPFLVGPMPNTYFMRDPFTCIGNGVAICKMHTKQRARENLFAKYIFTYHSDYNDAPIYYNRDFRFNIEGGDILVLNRTTLAIGISQRTHANAVEELARKILNKESGFTKILAIDIPKQRTFMHLDTVFTMIDKDVFSIHPNTEKSFRSLLVTKDEDGQIKIDLRDGALEDILKEVLNLDKIKLIKCGGNSVIDSAREQWNDGANTLAIAPGEVVVYARNNVTNQLFVDNGIIVHEIPCSELSRGRGGPRCMTMPIVRIEE